MKLSIIVPMLNEAEGLPSFAAQLEGLLAVLASRHGIDRREVEVIAVDDGSTDDTPREIAAMSSTLPVRIVRHERNRGVGAAIWTGLGVANGELIAMADADCTYGLDGIAELITLLDQRTDIVTASPYHPLGRVVGANRYRLVLSRGASFLYSILLGRRLHTYTALFRVYRREALRGVPARSTGFLAITQLLIYPALAGRVIKEFPATLTQRRFGSSKMKVLRTIREHLGFMLEIALHRVGLRSLLPRT